MSTERGRSFDTSYAAAAAMLVAYLLLQLLTIGYGTGINDVPEVAKARVDVHAIRGSGLERDVLVSKPSEDREVPDLWWLRFKLYSIEADEVVSVLALQRINAQRNRPDPGFYQYGGAYLYPLGAWLYALSRLGVIELGPLDALLDDPQRMDRVWIYGRLFVLLSFVASAAVFFATARRVAAPSVSLLLLGLYVGCPASIMFPYVMKPHWYALIWVNIVALLLISSFDRGKLSLRDELFVGACVGLAVGSALTFALFSVIVWAFLLILVKARAAPSLSLIRLPASAGIALAATNPYYFLNWKGVLAERLVVADWFRPHLSLRTLWLFADNSLLTGFGIALTAALGAAAFFCLARPAKPLDRFFAVALLLPLIFVAALTASIATWHVNLRYAGYVLPLGLILLGCCCWPRQKTVLGIVLVATLLQALPLKLAYFDEDDPAHSNRLRAAAWVNENIPAGDTICLSTKTPAPYEVPPFRLDRYQTNAPACRWKVLFERETDSIRTDPDYSLVERFRPRLSPEGFPLVFGHINPQISIYRRD